MKLKIICLCICLTLFLIGGCTVNEINEISTSPETSDTTVDITYEINNDASDYNVLFTERGYLIKQENGNYTIIIMQGEHATGGYSINIKDVSLEEDTLNIVVEETSPGPMDMVTQAFTYPTCEISINVLPSKIKITNTDGYEFNKV